jgi:hypothetical protein
MKSSTVLLAAALPLLLLAGCASVPTGPSVMTLPGSGKTFDQFRADDAECRQYALDQVGGADADRAAVDAGVRSAAVGTAIGAVVGAAVGGRQGAAVGAGGGLMVGSVAGSGAAQSSSYGTQRRYDHAYVQCMYAKGHKVPVSESMMRSQPPAAPAPAAPADNSYPPPPPPPTR